jgi:hypothetical protein
MASVRATIVDGDNTLWKGGAIAGIGASLILQELRRLHFSSVINVMAAERGISKVLRKYSGIEGKLMGQELLYQMLASSGIARRDDLSRFAANYIRNNAVGSVCKTLSPQSFTRAILSSSSQPAAHPQPCLPEAAYSIYH